MVSLYQVHCVISGLSPRTCIREGRYEAPSGVRATTIISSIASRLYNSKQCLQGFSNYTELAIAVCNDLINMKLLKVVIPSDARYVQLFQRARNSEHSLTLYFSFMQNSTRAWVKILPITRKTVQTRGRSSGLKW